ncbi:glycoside hydrolase family 97 protein [Sphingobacterium thalpophilum]|uniref:Retaining alpha-galactosidase n=1 Tax=Sphingobacterium thalpophilum TaxID=259 RepID=A0A4U9VLG0_9SPHI|nr:glycoside hydrolase family 97 protein [Sphingobacterium thalpophilum]VTR48030.1 Retaining alpha-galactosidase precursor [Sphingobacterium thalpophilum]
MKTFLVSIFLYLSFGLCAQTITVQSPNGQIAVHIDLSNELQYTVFYKGQPLIYPSPLGFELQDGPAIHKGFTLLNDARSNFQQESWAPVVKNKHAQVTMKWNETHLALVEKGGEKRRMDLFFRAYNNGIAFRYQLYSSQRIGNRAISREMTGFSVPAHAQAWIAEYDPSYTSSQESEFNKRPVSALKPTTVAGLPLLVEINKDNYLAITEANLDNFPGCYIGREAEDTTAKVMLTTKLSPLPGEKEEGIKARFADKIYTPWRVVMIADKPGHFIESEIVQSLNPPCAIDDPSWIQPGLCAWDHWWSGEVKMEMAVIKQYIDFAAAQGWPYMLIDWQWYGPFNQAQADITKPAPQLDMTEIIAYARERNVRIWLWLYSTDANRNNAFEEAFALYQQWGIAGVKIDFMDRDDQDMVNWYRKVIKKAAEHRLMVNFHGAYKPDGIERTYPNMITREGVLGEEYAKFSKRITAAHNVTLPFTRMLAGPMDYTPGGFLNVTPERFKNQSPTQVMNTRCAELAKFVIYESPLTVFSDHPKHVLGQPGSDFLKIVPTVWDDIRFIDGYPGEYIALAKRSGKNWFIGAMNNHAARKIDLLTDFLPAGEYELEYWADANDATENPTKLQKKRLIIESGTTITIRMANSGGYVAVLKPL